MREAVCPLWGSAILLLASTGWNAYLYRRRRRLHAALSVEEDEDDVIGRHPFVLSFAAEIAAGMLYALGVMAGVALPRTLGKANPGATLLLLPNHPYTRGSLFLLALRLARRGFRVHLLPLPAAANRLCLAPAASEEIAALVRRLGAERDVPVYVVGHGLGGLLARAALAHFPAGAAAHVLTLGSAHQGTVALPWPSSQAPSGALVARLRDVDTARARLTAIYSAFDATILPAWNAYCPGAFNVQIQNLGHAGLLFSRRVCALLSENLSADPTLGRRRTDPYP